MEKTKSNRSEAARLGWKKRKAAKIKAVEARAAALGVSADSPFITQEFEDKGMSQIYSSGMEYAFVSPDGKQCHAFAYCKDFLQDAVWATLNKSKAAIYGFSYAYGVNPPLDLDYTRLAVRYKGESKFKEMCLKSLAFLNTLEVDFGMTPTTLIYGGPGKEGNSIWVFVGDKKWMHAPPMISLYSLLIRVGLSYEGGAWSDHVSKSSFVGSNDKSYLSTSMPAIKFLTGKKVEEVFADDLMKNYPSSVPVSTMHGCSGISCMGRSAINSSVNEYWKIKSING